MRDQDCAIAEPCRPSSGMTFGDITTRVDEIVEAASELKIAYENDVNVVGLTDRAARIRRLSGSLETVLADIDTVMTGLIT